MRVMTCDPRFFVNGMQCTRHLLLTLSTMSALLSLILHVHCSCSSLIDRRKDSGGDIIFLPPEGTLCMSRELCQIHPFPSGRSTDGGCGHYTCASWRSFADPLQHYLCLAVINGIGHVTKPAKVG